MRKIDIASEFILKNIKFLGHTAVILGSGLGGFTDSITKKIIIKYSKIPYYPETTVDGHSGELIAGYLKGKNILIANGRSHFYEGHSKENIVLPINVMKSCGIKNLIITNSVGSLKREYNPGTIVLINGYIDFSFQQTYNKPRSMNDSRFFSEKLMSITKNASLQNNIPIKYGNYCWVFGPGYETSSEINYFKSYEGTVVGMSTLPEVEEAGNIGLKILTLSMVTNFAAGISNQPLKHSEVLENANKSKEKMIKLLSAIIQEI